VTLWTRGGLKINGALVHPVGRSISADSSAMMSRTIAPAREKFRTDGVALSTRRGINPTSSREIARRRQRKESSVAARRQAGRQDVTDYALFLKARMELLLRISS